jgi:hypothetical protein
MHQPRLLTMLLNHCNIEKPDMVFVLPLKLTAADVVERFKAAGRDDEAQRCVEFDPRRLRSAARFAPQTPIMEGALACVRKVVLASGETVDKM